MQTKDYSIFNPDYEKNPIDTFNYLRENDPIHFEKEINAYFASKYEDVEYILQNNEVFTTKTLAKRAEPVMKDRVLAQMTGHEHKSKKATILKGITGQNLERLMPLISKRVNDIIELYMDTGEMDLVNDFGKVFAVQSSMDLLGLNVEDHKIIGEWHHGIAKFITSFNLTEEEIKYSLECSDKLEQYLMPIIRERKNSTENDLISLLQQSKDDENSITDSEILALTLNILLAATEPVDKTLSYLFYNLLSDPEQFKQVYENRKLLKNSIQETLRLHSPVQFIPRELNETVDLKGTTLKKGDVIICMIGSANRDPKAYSNPDLFDIHRGEKNKPFTSHSQNLAFGKGAHTCVGASLSLIQLEMVANILLDKLDNIKLKENNQLIEKGLYTRGPEKMVVQFN